MEEYKLRAGITEWTEEHIIKVVPSFIGFGSQIREHGLQKREFSALPYLRRSKSNLLKKEIPLRTLQ